MSAASSGLYRRPGKSREDIRCNGKVWIVLIWSSVNQICDADEDVVSMLILWCHEPVVRWCVLACVMRKGVSVSLWSQKPYDVGHVRIRSPRAEPRMSASEGPRHRCEENLAAHPNEQVSEMQAACVRLRVQNPTPSPHLCLVWPLSRIQRVRKGSGQAQLCYAVHGVNMEGYNAWNGQGPKM